MKVLTQVKSKTHGWCTILKLRIIIFLWVCSSNKNNFLLDCWKGALMSPLNSVLKEILSRERKRGEFIMFSLLLYRSEPGSPYGGDFEKRHQEWEKILATGTQSIRILILSCLEWIKYIWTITSRIAVTILSIERNIFLVRISASRQRR